MKWAFEWHFFAPLLEVDDLLFFNVGVPGSRELNEK